MLQVATFTLPAQQQEANEFLKTHKPDGQVHFNTNMIVVFFDDGVVSPEWEIADLQELLKGQAGARFQQEITLFVLNRQRADLKKERSTLKSSQNKGRVEEIDNVLSNVEQGIKEATNALGFQDVKEEYVKQRIATLKRVAE